MKPAHAVVGLGLVALAAGVVSLWSIFSRAEADPVAGLAEPVPVSATSEAEEWDGVDQSIRRVLVDLGVASVLADGPLDQLPNEVAGALAGLGIPLVTADGFGG